MARVATQSLEGWGAQVKFLAAEALRGSGGIILDNAGQRFCDDVRAGGGGPSDSHD